LVIVFLVAITLAPPAQADGLPVEGVELGNVGVGDARVRYLAENSNPDTLVQRLEAKTGRPLAARLLSGELTVPVVAYDSSPGGLSADGRTLVLIAPRHRFPRARTRFVVLAARTLRPRKTIRLRGDYSFDAISPDGRWMYLIHYTSPKNAIRYEVVALDLRSGRLASKPIVDPREPDEKMNGRPLTRAASADGRWAYTLYDGTEHPFVHALDTVGRDARCVDLDWLTGHRSLQDLRFALRREGRELALRTPGKKPVAVVDTTTFEASAPRTAGVGSLPKTVLSLLALLAALGAVVYVKVRPRLAPPPRALAAPPRRRRLR
jgi:hypothetical protein